MTPATMKTDTTTETRHAGRTMHIALDTRDVRAATRFYEAFFDVPPAKTKPRYAKFTLHDPPLALALIESGAAPGPNEPRGGLNHLGFRVGSTDDVESAITRLTKAGLAEKVERKVDCCYARQDKVWARDPDGNRWEVYTVLADADALSPAPSSPEATKGRPESSDPSVCCASTMCCAS